MNTEDVDKIKQHCWNRAVYSYGTAWFFKNRANKLLKMLKFTQLLAIVVPVSVGSIAMSFGAFPNFLQYAITCAGILSFIQLILTVVSLTYHWQENYFKSIKSLEVNESLTYRNFKVLLKLF